MKSKSEKIFFKNILLYGGVSFLVAFFFFILGILGGATFGGNFICGHIYYALCDYSSFAGVRGYETTGIIGGMLGVFFGSCLSLTFLSLLKKQKAHYLSLWCSSFCAVLLGLLFLQLLYLLGFVGGNPLSLLAFFFPYGSALFVLLKQITK